MKTWFLNLSLREKQVVLFGGALLGLFLIYEIVFASLSNSVSNLHNKVQSDTKLLSWMQTTNQQIKFLQKSAQPSSEPISGSLLNVVQSNLKDTSFEKNVTQLQQSENDSVEIKLQNIPFDEFAKWLINFTQQNQLTISEFTATPLKDPGTVNVDVKFS